MPWAYGSSGERLVSPELTYAIDLLSLPKSIWDNLLPLIKHQIEATVHSFLIPFTLPPKSMPGRENGFSLMIGILT